MVRNDAVSLRLAALLALAFALPAEAAPKAVCGLPVATEAAMSSDGKMAALIRQEPTGDPVPEFAKAGTLWLRDCRTGKERRLMPPAGMPNTAGNIRFPVFDLDGRFIYVSVWSGGNGTDVYRVDPATGRFEKLFSAGISGIIRSGPYRGDFLANNPTDLYSGKGDDSGHIGYPYYVFDPEGHVLRYIGGSQTWDDKRLRRWLKGQGWEVSWAGKLTP